MEKERFIALMDEFEKIYRGKKCETDKLSDIFGGHIDFIGGELIDFIVKVLHTHFPPTILEDKSTFSDIEWFVFDCDFGKSKTCSTLIVRNKDGESKYSINNAEDLYNALHNNYSLLKQH